MILSSCQKTDFLIVGAGILGLTIAKKLIDEGYDNIIILEKEKNIGMHSSGRNSGVLHAGIYYGSDSLKAKFCLSGNLKMQEYCRQKALPLENCGKVIVARSSNELSVLDKLHRQALENGADVSMIGCEELSKIEPSAKTFDRAIYSKSTASINPKLVLDSLARELIENNRVKFVCGVKYIGLHSDNTALTSAGKIVFKKLINVAGSYADKVAHSFGLAKNLTSLPFKGVYFKLKNRDICPVNGNIYPVPDLRNPFLGVHFSKNIHGDIYLGPTAIPCFGRENYRGIKGIGSELFPISYRFLKLLVRNNKFRSVALTEPKKYLKKYFYQDAKKLVKTLDMNMIESTPKVGIRPQLVNKKTNDLVMDFVVESTSNSCHIINAVSPAFTSSFAIADSILKEYIL